eukprot:13050510-Ditylum_brightwellii.AAC.1
MPDKNLLVLGLPALTPAFLLLPTSCPVQWALAGNTAPRPWAPIDSEKCSLFVLALCQRLQPRAPPCAPVP